MKTPTVTRGGAIVNPGELPPLLVYGQHLPTCGKWWRRTRSRGEHLEADRPCTCGYEQAVREWHPAPGDPLPVQAEGDAPHARTFSVTHRDLLNLALCAMLQIACRLPNITRREAKDHARIAHIVVDAWIEVEGEARLRHAE